MTNRTRILTGITTTGTPHLGNYAGAIRPAIVASRDSNADSFYFLADYHALIKCDDPLRIQRSRLEIAATWLAGGLDVDRVTFYRQSDIPEIPELTWLLTCVAAKGLLNRAHAYKASVDKNVEAGEDPDAGITMGLFSYPVLMAADILMFNAHKVPVGRDQIQHVEMARDIGQRFNHLFGKGKEFFTMPEALIEESVATLPGLDGRKMSKSYDNTIPLFTSAKDMKDAISRIVTDSRAAGRGQGSGQLAPVHPVPGIRHAGASRRIPHRTVTGPGLGRGQAAPVPVAGRRTGRGPRALPSPDRASGRSGRHPASGRRKRPVRVATPFLDELREAVGLRSFRTPVQIVSGDQEKGQQRPRASSASVKTTAASASVCWRPMASNCCCRATSPTAKPPVPVTKQLQQGGTLDMRSEGDGFSLWLEGELCRRQPGVRTMPRAPSRPCDRRRRQENGARATTKD